jgi:hypothetical protein
MIGWSWFIEDLREHPQTIGHTGSQGGFFSVYRVVRDKQIFIVLLLNTHREIKML